MKIHLSGDNAFLWGEWTDMEMNFCNIERLTGLLDQISQEGRKQLKIDVAHLGSIDGSGARFLDIWFHCLKLRGIEFEFINILKNLEVSFRVFSHHQNFSRNIPFDRKFLGPTRNKRKISSHNRKAANG